jgi:hypothetical protein
MSLELWLRPWALLTGNDYRIKLDAAPSATGAAFIDVPDDHAAPLYIFAKTAKPPTVDGRDDNLETHAVFTSDKTRHPLWLIPFFAQPSRSCQLALPRGPLHLRWPAAPVPLAANAEPKTPQEQAAKDLMARVEAVWGRLRDVETALRDPLDVWSRVAQNWLAEEEAREPEMSVIVRQASLLKRTLDMLEKTPRRILRRTHEMTPLGRVQELDRRALLWLVRQPGETLAERAGPSQRIRAVARHRNYDTLENRVLRSYADLARSVARDYTERNKRATHSRRVASVRSFAKQCRRIEHKLADEMQVRLARPDVIPNFVLQSNPQYREIWKAWQDLLSDRKKRDEMWRWQARSFEEFCAVAVMVALQTLPGARLIAASPLTFREEQQRGRWLDHDNPLGVFHLAEQDLVLEVQHRPRGMAAVQQDFGAPLWLRVGDLNDSKAFLRRIAVWQLASPKGGLISPPRASPGSRSARMNGRNFVAPRSASTGITSAWRTAAKRRS